MQAKLHYLMWHCSSEISGASVRPRCFPYRYGYLTLVSLLCHIPTLNPHPSFKFIWCRSLNVLLPIRCSPNISAPPQILSIPLHAKGSSFDYFSNLVLFSSGEGHPCLLPLRLVVVVQHNFLLSLACFCHILCRPRSLHDASGICLHY